MREVRRFVSDFSLEAIVFKPTFLRRARDFLKIDRVHRTTTKIHTPTGRNVLTEKIVSLRLVEIGARIWLDGVHPNRSTEGT